LAYDLIATSGPLAGERFALDDSQELVIGRTQRGINIPDPLVSVNHAKLVYASKQWTISDLDSATGTQVNGEPLEPGTPVPIDVGDVIAIGEGEFTLDSSGSRVVRRLLWAMFPAWILVLVAIAVLYWASGDRPVVLSLTKPIHTFSGEVKQIEVPKVFIRRHGLNVSKLSWRDTTDKDQNGIDELWLQVGDKEIVVTFTEKGWKLLGKIPQGCVERGGEFFPDLDCDGLSYRMLDGRYVAVDQVDPVVWFIGDPAGEYERKIEDPTKKKGRAKAKSTEGEGPKVPVVVVPELQALKDSAVAVPYRLSMGKADLLAGFLTAHGVNSPVHYIICEDVFLGVPAQALLEGGRVQQLSYGCGDEIGLRGSRAPAFEGARVAAIAFTAIGREMLPKHLSYTWSGAPEPIFLNNRKRATLKTFSQWPISLRGGVYVVFKATEHIFHPIAREPSVDPRIRLVSEQVSEVEAITASLLSRGRGKLDPDGCAVVEVRTGNFRCAVMRGCFPGSRFISIYETGCGKEELVMRVGYGSGITDGKTENVEVRVQVISQSAGGITDVIQARVGARPTE